MLDAQLRNEIADVRLRLGRDCLGRQQYSQAIDEFLLGVAASPDAPLLQRDLRYYWGMTYHYLRDYPRVRGEVR